MGLGLADLQAGGCRDEGQPARHGEDVLGGDAGRVEERRREDAHLVWVRVRVRVKGEGVGEGEGEGESEVEGEVEGEGEGEGWGEGLG